MPPRFAYWTILIGDKPTAFRAREREELLPTFGQLQRKNTDVTMRWFARGRLWASREAERDDFQMRKHAAAAPRDRRADRGEGAERRGSDWRPGGTHKDPRDRFKKKNRPERGWSEKDPATQRDRDKPGFASWSRLEPRRGSSDSRAGGGGWRDKPTGPPMGNRASREKPRGKPQGDRPWGGKPGGKRPWVGGPPNTSAVTQGVDPAKPRERKAWSDKPPGGAPPGDRPWQTKPTGPRSQRKPWSNKPPGGAPGDDRRWQGKPDRKPQGDRPWTDSPPRHQPRDDREAWQTKPSSGEGKPPRPRTGPPRNSQHKKRDDEPPDRG